MAAPLSYKVEQKLLQSGEITLLQSGANIAK